LTQGTGSRGMVYTSTSLDSIISCNGSRTGGMTNYYREMGAYPIADYGIANIPGQSCYGVGAGVSIGEGVIGIAIVATVSSCSGQSVAVNMDTHSATAYTNWEDAVHHSRWRGQVSEMYSLCKFNDISSCVSFPTVGTGYGSLFVNAAGISANADGAVAEVMPPPVNPMSSLAGRCSLTNCWQAGVIPSDCPVVYQTPEMTVQQTAHGGVLFDPQAQSIVDPVFLASKPTFFLNSAEQCAYAPGATGSTTSAISMQTTFAGQSARQDRCVTAGQIPLPFCNGYQSTALAGSTNPVPSSIGEQVLLSCQSQGGMAATFITHGTTPPNAVYPWSGGCINTTRGIMQCTVCGDTRLCYPAAFPPPRSMSTRGGASKLDNTTWIFPQNAQGGLCRLAVYSQSPTSISVQASNAPCITAGQMGTREILSQVTVVLHVNVQGWVYQMIDNGTLAWHFNDGYVPPQTRRLTGNTTVDHNVKGPCLDDSDCQCVPWECSGELLCLMAKNDWTSCKCSLISNWSGATKMSCRIIVTLLRILIYGAIVILGISLIMWIVRCIQRRREAKAQPKALGET
jgi:hypothetical protein